MASYRTDYTGLKYNRIELLYYSHKYKSESIWFCKCHCGNVYQVASTRVVAGKSTSCGCTKFKSRTKHGHSKRHLKTPEYRCWSNMKRRCCSIDSPLYPYYGGRGITVCPRWLESFENFLTDMGKRPTKKHSLDRYPNNETGNYEPSNCRWGTGEQQSKNRRSNIWYELNGRKMIQKEWGKELGLKDASCISYHIKKGKTFQEIYFMYSKRNKLS